jgi:beta-xylosidase
MGLLREDGTPKPALDEFTRLSPELGICQWFHFEDYRLDDAVEWLRRLRVRHLRTGLSWSDSLRPGALQWFDRQMTALAEFDVTVTFCFTPDERGIAPHHTSPPVDPSEYADFCARMVRRYAPAGSRRSSEKPRKKEDQACQTEPRSQPTTTKSAAGSRNGEATLPP